MRKKHDVKLRYFKACRAALRNVCVAWHENGENCLINLKTNKVYKTIPADILDALVNVTYRWSIHVVVAGKSNRQFTKGSVIKTLSKYYVSDLIDVVYSEFEKLEKNINRDHYHNKGYIAIPRIEDLSEAQVEALLDSIGVWNHEN
jgi:hypothetical protein